MRENRRWMKNSSDSFSLQRLPHISCPWGDEWPARQVQPEWPIDPSSAKGKEIGQIKETSHEHLPYKLVCPRGSPSRDFHLPAEVLQGASQNSCISYVQYYYRREKYIDVHFFILWCRICYVAYFFPQTLALKWLL